MTLYDEASSLVRKIISSYKDNNMLVTAIELRVLPKIIPELTIEYFDIDEKKVMLNVSVLDVGF